MKTIDRIVFFICFLMFQTGQHNKFVSSSCLQLKKTQKH